MIALSRPVRALARLVTGRGGEAIRRDLYADAEFRKMFEELGCEFVRGRHYNKLLLPWPATTLTPELARRAAERVEGRSGLHFLATGYVAAFRTQGSGD